MVGRGSLGIRWNARCMVRNESNKRSDSERESVCSINHAICLSALLSLQNGSVAVQKGGRERERGKHDVSF